MKNGLFYNMILWRQSGKSTKSKWTKGSFSKSLVGSQCFGLNVMITAELLLSVVNAFKHWLAKKVAQFH